MAVRAPRQAGAPRARLLSAALELFARNGVSGTSLQMIADELGVTKAAVYHLFHSKEEIVLAVVSPALERLAGVADFAESRSGRRNRQEAVLAGLIDLIVENRRLAAVLYSDHSVADVVRNHAALGVLSNRINRLLTGPDPDTETRIGAAMVTGGLAIVGVDPMIGDIDDEAFRQHLLTTARRILRLRNPAQP